MSKKEKKKLKERGAVGVDEGGRLVSRGSNMTALIGQK